MPPKKKKGAKKKAKDGRNIVVFAFPSILSQRPASLSESHGQARPRGRAQTESETGEYKPWTKHGRNMDDPWINVSITGCAYRAELILGR